MLKRLLVPLDESPYSTTALEKGFRIAARTRATITGLCIVDDPAITAPEPTPMGAGDFHEHKTATLQTEGRNRAQKMLQEFEATCNKQGLTGESRQRIGHPYLEIRHESHRHDLLVLGQKSHFKYITQRSPCDTVEQVLKANPRPIILTPKELPDSKEVIITNDGSPGASKSIQMFQLMGLGNERTLRIVSINKSKTEAQQHCAEVEDYLKSHDIAAESDAIESSQSPQNVLQEYLEKRKPGLVVMGAYGISGLKELFFGSVTKKLLNHATIPLFLYH